MRGKNKCKILRQIRQQIAEENDIALVTKECTYQGECTGTCPRCEAELRYLEQQLARRQSLGKAVTVAALSVSLMAGAVGCSQPTAGEPEIPVISAPETTEGEKSTGDGALKLLPDGTYVVDLEELEDLGSDAPVLGMIPAPSEEQTEIVELEGDIAYIPITEDTEFPGAPLPDEETSEPGMLETVGGNG